MSCSLRATGCRDHILVVLRVRDLIQVNVFLKNRRIQQPEINLFFCFFKTLSYLFYFFILFYRIDSTMLISWIIDMDVMVLNAFFVCVQRKALLSRLWSAGSCQSWLCLWEAEDLWLCWLQNWWLSLPRNVGYSHRYRHFSLFITELCYSHVEVLQQAYLLRLLVSSAVVRKGFGDAGLVTALLSVLTSTNEELLIYAARAISRMSYDSCKSSEIIT